MGTRSELNPQQTAHCACDSPCECGQTGRLLIVRLPEFVGPVLKDGCLEKSKLAHHVCGMAGIAPHCLFCCLLIEMDGCTYQTELSLL
jgi:hypothetical protein